MTGTGTDPDWSAVTHGGTAGTFQVASDIKLVSGTTTTASGCVPTAQAVVDYVAKHGGGDGKYNGPFAATDTGIKGGLVCFNNSSIATAGDYTGTADGTYWCVITKSGNSYTATIQTSPGTGIYTASYPVVQRSTSGGSQTVSQLQWGAINVIGRWM